MTALGSAGPLAYGKVIVLGEHAVVWGHAALAGALDRGVRCRADASATPLSLSIPAWSLDVAVDEDHPVARALAAIASAAKALHLRLRLTATTELPAAAGLGSSAALSVALARALGGAAGSRLSRAAIEKLAAAGESCFHAHPSGVDVALASRGGLGLFRRERGLEAIRSRPLPLVVGLSDERRQTAIMVENVAAARARSPRAAASLDELGAAALRGADALERADLPALGAELTLAQAHLAALKLSTAIIDSMVASALAAGALGAKLTGAGGGGAVIALAPGREEAILEVWRAAGHEAFRCELGAAPPAAEALSLDESHRSAPAATER